jgi:hypothetical protein
LFHKYAQFAAKTDIEPQPSEDERRTEEQLNETLEKVTRHLPFRTSWRSPIQYQLELEAIF